MSARNWNWSVGGRAGFRHPHNPHLIPAAEVLRVARALLDEEVPDAEPRLVSP